SAPVFSLSHFLTFSPSPPPTFSPAHSLPVSLPQPLQRPRQRLPRHPSIRMARSFRENVAIRVALRLEHGGHALIRHHPVVQRRLVALGAVVIFTHVQPDADRLALALRNQVLVILPCAVRRRR